MKWNLRRKKESSERTSAEKLLYIPLQLRGNLRNRKQTQMLILLLSALAVILAVIVVIFTVDFGSSYSIKEAAYQYYGGNTSKIEAGAKLKRSGEEKTLLVQDGYSSEAILPVYLKKSPAIVLTTDMMYLAPRSGICERAVYFSEVKCDDNGTVTVTRNGKSQNPQQGFLYDGGDFYLFLEPMKLSFNGYSMDVPALSYVEAVYGGYMMVFNYETKEFFIELSDGSGTAQTPSGDYVISLLGDSMTLHDGSRQLLAIRPDLFDPIV